MLDDHAGGVQDMSSTSIIFLKIDHNNILIVCLHFSKIADIRISKAIYALIRVTNNGETFVASGE